MGITTKQMIDQAATMSLSDLKKIMANINMLARVGGMDDAERDLVAAVLTTEIKKR